MVSNLIDKIRTLIELKKRKLRTESLLLQLKSDTDEDVKKLLNIFNFITTNNSWTDEEIEAFNKVNEIRNKYLNSNETITIRDYGVGNSRSKRTREQMDEGTDETSAISKVYINGSIPEKWGKVIFKIIRDFKPLKCLELGTSLGIPASYQILALKLNNQGKFITIEGSEELAKIADNNLKNLHYQNYSIQLGRFRDVLPITLSENKPIDFVFIDGHHDRIATKEYFEILYPFLANKSILVFDDINWSKGMKDVWHEIYQDKRVKLSFDLHKWGICIIEKDNTTVGLKYYKIAI